jgi:hypothetical protein
MAFEFFRDDATRELYVAAVFDCWNIQNIQVVLLDKMAPDENNRPLFCRQ